MNKPTTPTLATATRFTKCNSPICKGARRWFAYHHSTDMGQKVYVCCHCGQEKKVA